MKVIFNITENKNKAIFQQEVVKINTSFNQTQNIVKPKFQVGYYPLPVGLENYYTKNETNLLLENYYLKSETYSKTEVNDIIADIPVVDTSNLVPYTGATQDVNIGAHYFESSLGFKLTDGEPNQYLMADGSTSTLPTDLIRGTGTLNYIPKFSASGTIGNSVIYDDGANVGVGTTSPSRKLDVNGDGRFQTNLTIGLTTNNNGTRTVFNGSTGGRSFQIANNWNVAGSFEITPSTTTAGSTFTTPALVVNGTTSNVGIGTTSPTEKLDVNGNVKANGFKIPTGTQNQVLTANGGVFDLNTKADLENGKIPATQLPSYVDDVLEFANLASFPATGESGKIYIAIDTNLTYRWGGSSYVVMSSSLALGETSSTAYRGDRGKTAYDHSQATGNPHGTTKTDIGLGNVPNVDATNPENITQSANYRFFTDTERTKLNSITGINTGDETNATILAKIGYPPEDVANKSLNVLSDKTSNSKFPSVKAVYDWGMLEFNKRLKSYTFSDYNSFPSFVEVDALYIDSTFGDLYIGWSDPNYMGEPTTEYGNVYKQIGIGKNVNDLENYYSKNVSDSRYVILQNGKVPASQSQPSTMVMNSSTYVITFTDATGAVQTIDLPLESLFKDANYNSSTKSLIVTLQDGTTRTIPLTDLVDLPEIVLATTNPAVTPTTGQKVYFNTSLGKVWFNVSGVWVFGGNLISDSEKANITTAYNHSQTSGNLHNTKVEELTDVGSETPSIEDTDVILKKESGGLWRKITWANIKSTLKTYFDNLYAPKAFNIKVTTPSSYVTGTVAETEVLRIEIPANSLSASDVLRMPFLMINKIGTNATMSIRGKLSTSPTMPTGGQDQIFQFLGVSATIQYVGLDRQFIIEGGQIKGFPFSINSAANSINSNGQFSFKSFDRTVTNYLYVSIQLFNTADQARLEGMQLTNS